MAKRRRLFRHQLEALKWTKDRKRFGLFMEMRLGKTLTTIRHVERLGAVSRVVVAPLSVLPTWERELSAEGHRSSLLSGSVEQRLSAAQVAVREGRWALVNYEGLHSNGKAQPWTSLPWDVCVLDESTQIRNPKALRSKVACEAFRDTTHKIILSGMPTPTSVWDLFQQMVFLHGEFLGHKKFWPFRDMYGIAPYMGWGEYTPKLGAAKFIRREAAKTCLSVRREDADIRVKKVVVRRYVDLPREQREQYRTLKREWVVGDTEYDYAVQRYNAMSQLCAGCLTGAQHDAKTNELIDLLQGELAGQRVVVWTRYLEENSRVHKAVLSKLGRPVWSVTGSSPADSRVRAVEHWERSNFGVLVAQQSVFKFGLDLSAADTAVYVSVSDDSEEVVQSMERVVNVLKTTPLLYVFVVARDTLEDRRLDLLEERTTSAKDTMQALREGARATIRAIGGVA